MNARIGAILALLVMLAACGPATTGTPESAMAVDNADAVRSGAVVADISLGTNPYHEVFRRSGWDQQPCKTVSAIPCDLPELKLTLGDDYASDLAADAAVWAAYKPGIVYWVPGTNLLLLTLRSPAATLCGASGSCIYNDGYGGPGASHGTWSSGATAKACRNCYVLVVQDAPGADGSGVEYVAKNLPWVDFATATTLSGDGNPLATQGPLLESYQDSTLHLSQSGRLFFAATGDFAVGGLQPAPDLGYGYPPWIVATGGMTARNPLPDAVEKDCNAIEMLSGGPADLLGDFFQRLPSVGSVADYDIAGGTSFAAPQLAGRFASALIAVRSELNDTRAPGALWAGKSRSAGVLSDGVLTADEMREVFDAAAKYFSPTDFNVACVAEMDQRFISDTSLATPQRPVSLAPWFDMGWGYVGPDEAALAAAAILGEATLPAKAAEASAYMGAVLSARVAAYPIP